MAFRISLPQISAAIPALEYIAGVYRSNFDCLCALFQQVGGIFPPIVTRAVNLTVPRPVYDEETGHMPYHMYDKHTARRKVKAVLDTYVALQREVEAKQARTWALYNHLARLQGELRPEMRKTQEMWVLLQPGLEGVWQRDLVTEQNRESAAIRMRLTVEKFSGLEARFRNESIAAQR